MFSGGMNVDQTEMTTQDLQRQLEEKDRKIQLLEVKVQQLTQVFKFKLKMKMTMTMTMNTQDTSSILDEHQRLKEENLALMKALSSLKR